MVVLAGAVYCWNPRVFSALPNVRRDPIDSSRSQRDPLEIQRADYLINPFAARLVGSFL